MADAIEPTWTWRKMAGRTMFLTWTIRFLEMECSVSSIIISHLLQLNGEVGGWGHLALLSSAIEPLVEGYWLTATQLLITLPNTPGTHLTGQSSL